MKRYFFNIAYFGTKYHGWQIQPNAISVQEIIQQRLSTIFGLEQLDVLGCGRTDTGVHASDFYFHVDLEEGLNLENLLYRLNRFLPHDIVCKGFVEVNSNAHARFDATSRVYHYHLHEFKDPFLHKNSWFYAGELNEKEMNKAGEMLCEYTDFTSFSKLHTQVFTNNCKVEYARWIRNDSRLLFEIKADRFLRNMVRSIVGTMIEIGEGKRKAEDIKTIIEAKDRSVAGVSVPAIGLYLQDIEYPYISK